MGITGDLIKLCEQDNADAQVQLYRLCYGRLFGVCRRYESIEHDSGALFNSGFYKVLKGLGKHQFRDEESFLLWARRVIINDMIDLYRRTKTYHAHNSSTDFSGANGALLYHPSFSSSVTNSGAQDLDAEYLLELIAALPELQRKVFNLHAIDEYPHKEIAEILGMTEGTSKWYLSEARKALRKKLAAMNQNKKTSSVKL
jgi:RNA polymerase sigma-70 factor (ECF subfamily)